MWFISWTKAYIFQDFKGYSAVVIFQWGDVIVSHGKLSSGINLKQDIVPSVYSLLLNSSRIVTMSISPGRRCCSRCDLDRDRRLRSAWWGGQYCQSCFWDLLAISAHTSDKQMDSDNSISLSGPVQKQS